MDLDYRMAVAASALVPATVESGPSFKGATYTKHPVGSGPFMIQSYPPNKLITFVRNPNLSQPTDTIQHPLMDKVVLTVDTNAADAATAPSPDTALTLNAPGVPSVYTGDKPAQEGHGYDQDSMARRCTG